MNRTLLKKDEFPEALSPMLASSLNIPKDFSKWAVEFKWDGIRAIVFIRRGIIKIMSRNNLNITSRYPELSSASKTSATIPDVVLDGEIITIDETGTNSFSLLQKRMNVDSGAEILKLSREIPVNFYVFDVLYFKNSLTTSLPYKERRKILDKIKLPENFKLTPAFFESDLQLLIDTAKTFRLEGLILKNLSSFYSPGQRSGSWIKVKLLNRQEFVVGGFTAGQGEFLKTEDFGALLVGYMNEGGQLLYAGKVGSGFSDQERGLLKSKFQKSLINKSPFSNFPLGKKKFLKDEKQFFVKPLLVVEVEFNGFTKSGLLRQPVYKGLRSDKKHSQVTLETTRRKNYGKNNLERCN